MARAFQSNALTPLRALIALLIPFPGASSLNVQNMVAHPAEQVLSQMAGVEHTYLVAPPGLAVLTVQFKVGVSRTEALARLHDAPNANQDWLPRELGTHAVQTIGSPGRAVQVWLDPVRLSGRGVDVVSLKQSPPSFNFGMLSGAVLDTAAQSPQMLTVETSEFQRPERDVGDVVVGVSNGRPVYLRKVARIEMGARLPQCDVWLTSDNIKASITRDYDETAAEKANKLIQKLAFAFTVPPWLVLKLMKSHVPDAKGHAPAAPTGLGPKLQTLFIRVLTPFLDSTRKRWLLLAGILVALMLSVGLTLVQWVVMKMLPFDNQSEFAVVMGMPAGTPLENTTATGGPANGSGLCHHARHRGRGHFRQIKRAACLSARAPSAG